ncbi:unnamed protein product [marine sediment metagenome]|uniref:Uncharacterized protein n=1 Tax=marine sediment metagenome TaxID=412755 RepID=X1CR66_9ZZZZ
MKLMRVVAVLFVLVMLTSGCSMLGDSAKVTIRNKPVDNVKMTDVVEELQENYGEAIVKYRAYKLADGSTQVIKDMYFETGRDTHVIVTVVNDEVKEILSLDRPRSE